ncbi:hypothetical protein SAMN03159463_05921 [Mesorhizobium sp. NFR06]|jgi:hypothetical protein|uniref:hypothetical protein n=1 Tax=Mesorhizobium sp. NFR06 TaxID=1566290 RepID=UPI0008E9BFD4|nr:hypothetical protein [Mesorhizobium sp. NFR06]SFQ19033.1 hypothetical protein SAMN03159463_05921 [Mesorhizobium sp. NFR06]
MTLVANLDDSAQQEAEDEEAEQEAEVAGKTTDRNGPEKKTLEKEAGEGPARRRPTGRRSTCQTAQGSLCSAPAGVASSTMPPPP